MPIPTKKPSITTKTEGGTASQVPAARRPVSTQRTNKLEVSTDQKSDSSVTSTSTNTTTSKSRLLSRPTPQTSVSTTRHQRTASSNSSTGKPASATAHGASSRSTTTSSVKPVPSSVIKQSSGSEGTRLRTIAAPSRVTSASTNTSNKIPSTQTANLRSRPTSKLQQPSKSSAAHKASGAVTATRTATDVSKSESTPPASATTSRLQDENYQLQLVHLNSDKVLQQYKQSAQTIIDQKQTQLQEQETQLLALEATNNEALSLQNLKDWLDAQPQRKPDRAIQILSSTIADLAQLTEDSNALEPLHTFETWLSNALAVRDDRNNPTPISTPHASLTFIHPLGQSWTTQIHDLRHLLSSSLSTLHDLRRQKPNEIDPRSGLGILLSRHTTFASTLLQEIDTAVAIETAVLASEKEWERKQLETAMRELSAEEDHGLGAVSYRGVWT